MLVGLLLLLFCSNLLHNAICHNKHAVPTYFRRIDSNGELVNRNSKEYNAHLPKDFIDHISLEDSLSAVLKITPQVVADGGTVNVSWAGISSPNEDDFIAFYCPTEDKPEHYLDFLQVNTVSTWHEGLGQVQVVVYNLRVNCGFRYYRAGKIAKLVAISNEVSFKDGGPLAPLQGHISSTGNADEMRVMWVSGKVDSPVVLYGLSKQLELRQTIGISQTYKGSDMCEAPANSTGFWDPGYIHSFILSDLQIGRMYYYSFGGENHMSDIYNFTTIIPAGNHTPFQFIMYGDMGVAAYPSAVGTELQMLKEIRENNIRLIVHNGDISYACGQSYIWDQWHSIIQPYATLVPYMVGIGNHEQGHMNGGKGHDPSGEPRDHGYHPPWGNYGGDSGGECGVPMFKRFVMPDNGNKLWWYSFDYGLVHFTMISTEHDLSPGSRQYEWLEKDLKNVDRKKTPWLIVSGHRAMYCSSLAPKDYVVAKNLQLQFEDLLLNYNVDLAVWAHYHSYERTCKVYKEKCSDEGVTHIVVGSAGKSIDIDLWLERPWSMFHICDWGYGKVTVANATAMKWEWTQNRSGKVLDYVWLHK